MNATDQNSTGQNSTGHRTTERYIRRATRGLWGQKRQDAQVELRGAIEDKVYRYSLLGLEEHEAVNAALRDLGSPGAIAAGLSHVHTLPNTVKTVLFGSLIGLMSLQALAQVATVKSAFHPTFSNAECRIASAAELALASAANRARYERLLAAYGGADGFLTRCQAGEFNPLVMLRLADLQATLQKGGVPFSDAEAATPDAPLIVRGSPNVTISFAMTTMDGERYLESSMLIPFLKRTTPLPLTLSGVRNPVLTVGSVSLRLGTENAPVRTADLLASALMDERRTNTSLGIHVGIGVMPSSMPIDPAAPRLAVPGKDGDLYAVVQNILPINTSGGYNETLWVRAREKGQIQFTDELDVKPLIVTSLEALDAATVRKQKAALVYRLDASDLRNLKLTPVPAAQVKVVNP